MCWLYEENLIPLLRFLSLSVEKSQLDQNLEMEYLEQVAKTDYDRSQWYEIRFDGEFPSFIILAKDVGSAVVHVRFRGPEEFKAKNEYLCEFLSNIKSRTQL